MSDLFEEVDVGTEVTVGTNTSVTEAEPTSLVRWALEKDVDVGVLEKLVALEERLAEKNARAAMFAALGAFQDACPSIVKNRTASIRTKSGGTYSYTYATLDEIVRIVRPVLREHGLAFNWDSDESGGMVKTTCTLRHVDGHKLTATFTAPSATDAAMSGAQKNGAALTYGRRQSLVEVLGLTTADEDTDGAAPPSAEPITDEQLANLSALAEEVGADQAKFLRYLNVPSLSALPAHRYTQAQNALEAKRKESKK